jgi:hypothetical protein
MELSISTSQQETYNNNNRYKGTYLHGQLESDMEYDIFSFDQETKFETGVHQVIVNGVDCFFILWEDGLFVDEFRGYLIYQDDKDLLFCLKGFLDKKEYF